VLSISEEDYATAKQSKSGACLIRDAIARQYPELSKISVDMATIRASDRNRGLRFTYLTPPAGQHILLSFDQGWPQPTKDLVVQRAVKVTEITKSRLDTAKKAERLAELEAKEAEGTLTNHERSALTRMRRSPARPHKRGKASVRKVRGATVVIGGAPVAMGPAHPNLLRGTNRHFGARLADPGEVFNEAVEAEIARRAAEGEEA